MALIKCTECGQMVSDKASNCPNCGAPVEKRIVCEECGQEMPESSVECPNCGCPNPNVGTKQEVEQKEQVTIVLTSPKESKKSQVAVPMIIGIVVYIVITAILSNVFNGGKTYDAKISNDIGYCAIVVLPISWFLCKSTLERTLYLLIVILVSYTAYSNWRELMVGAGIIVHLTNICIIVVASLRRNKQIQKREMERMQYRASQATNSPDAGKEKKNRYVFALLALLLSGFGMHLFYIGKVKACILHFILFFVSSLLIGVGNDEILWYVPMYTLIFIAINQCVESLFMSQEDFERVYVNSDKFYPLD